jgi:hypothetical protein
MALLSVAEADVHAMFSCGHAVCMHIRQCNGEIIGEHCAITAFTRCSSEAVVWQRSQRREPIRTLPTCHTPQPCVRGRPQAVHEWGRGVQRQPRRPFRLSERPRLRPLQRTGSAVPAWW